MRNGRNTLSVRAPSTKQVRTIVMQNLKEWNTPRSLAIFLIMKNGCDKDFLTLKDIEPKDFNSAMSYAEFAYPTDLVRKSSILQLGIDTRAVAQDRFHQAERMCSQTNLRLNYSNDPTGRLGELLHQVRKNIRSILPEITRELLDNFVEDSGWGKGVTSSVKGKDKTFFSKLVSHQHSTTCFLPLAQALQREVLGLDGEVTVQDYNVVAFVPKNAKTDRAIAIEPSLNSFVQRGAGLAIRRGLKRFGVDLKHGQRRNAALARIGSLGNSYATIDLSMASDTIATKVVRMLLPDEWVTLLELLRSSSYKLDDEIHYYHKWSSMGNGYTFELESMIFAACADAVVGSKDWAVYGDDIIVPTYAAGELAELLSFFGFVLNTEKTFLDGPFRESCGEDFFYGVPVRGFYLKEINPVTPFVWYNWLAAERLLAPCPKTMAALIRVSGRSACYSPLREDGAFWLCPLPSDAHHITRGWKLGRYGWYYNKLHFVPITRPLSGEEHIGAVAVHCRLVLADEALDRLPVKLTLTEVGRWQRKRVFLDDQSFSERQQGPWPRG